MRGGDHADVQSLLPWHVTGRLDASEQAAVEDHLRVCAECQADLVSERRLSAAFVGAPLEVEHGLARLQHRLPARVAKRPRQPALSFSAGTIPTRGSVDWRTRGPWIGAALALQVVLLALLVTIVPPFTRSARYHALGAGSASVAANAVVIFRPDTSERRLRAMLRASHARLVDGPTLADAYVLHVPGAERAATLARLRALDEVVLAQPVDAGERP